MICILSRETQQRKGVKEGMKKYQVKKWRRLINIPNVAQIEAKSECN